MRIDNHTKWKTDDLRFIIGQAIQTESVRSTGLNVEVRNSRGRIAWRAWRDQPPHITSYIDLWMPRVRVDFDPLSPEHVEMVVDLARSLRRAAAALHPGGEPVRDDGEPIAWLADWYEVNRGPLGVKAGCLPSPLMPEPVVVVDRAAERAAMIAHTEEMHRRAVTRRKRAETIEKKWARKLARLRKG